MQILRILLTRKIYFFYLSKRVSALLSEQKMTIEPEDMVRKLRRKKLSK